MLKYDRKEQLPYIFKALIGFLFSKWLLMPFMEIGIAHEHFSRVTVCYISKKEKHKMPRLTINNMYTDTTIIEVVLGGRHGHLTKVWWVLLELVLFPLFPILFALIT